VAEQFRPQQEISRIDARQDSAQRSSPHRRLEAALEELSRLEAARQEMKQTEHLATTFKEEVAARRKEFDERYASLAGVDVARFLQTLEGRAILHRRFRVLGEEARELRVLLGGMRSGRRWGRGLLIGVPVAGAAGAALLFYQLPPPLAGAVFLFLPYRIAH
jgi:hypothetical protein